MDTSGSTSVHKRDELKVGSLEKIDDGFKERLNSPSFSWKTWVVFGFVTEFMIWMVMSTMIMFKKSASGLDEGECWRTFPFPCTRIGLFIMGDADNLIVGACMSLLLWPLIQYAIYGWFKVQWAQMWCFRSFYDREGFQPIGPAPTDRPWYTKVRYLPFWMQKTGFWHDGHEKYGLCHRMAINYLCGITYGVLGCVLVAAPLCILLVVLGVTGVLPTENTPVNRQLVTKVLKPCCGLVSALMWCLLQKGSAHLAVWHDKTGQQDTRIVSPLEPGKIRAKPISYRMLCILMMFPAVVVGNIIMSLTVVTNNKYKGFKARELMNKYPGGLWGRLQKDADMRCVAFPMVTYMIMGSELMRLFDENWVDLKDVEPFVPATADDPWYVRLWKRSREMRPITYRPKWCDDDWPTRFGFMFRTALLMCGWTWLIVRCPLYYLLAFIRGSVMTDEFDINKHGQILYYCSKITEVTLMWWNIMNLMMSMGPFMKYVQMNPGALKSQEWKETQVAEALDERVKTDAKKASGVKSDVSTMEPSGAASSATGTSAQ